jgi:hypothetical protein
MVLINSLLMRIIQTFIFLCTQLLISAQTYQDGDLIFQHSSSTQSTAVQLATNSYYSHCGIIFYRNGQAYVFEAIEPVGIRTLEDWIASGEKQHYAVYRLKEKTLTAAELQQMSTYLKAQLDKHYDIGFNWSDKEMYCSELVYKTYQNIGITLCPTQVLGTFRLDHPKVKHILTQRYGNNIPYDEPMVSPGQLMESKLLYKVF